MNNTISNDYADIEMWNLDPGAQKRGPLVIVQCGTAPGRELEDEQMFLLRHDGKWVNILSFGSTGKGDSLDEVVFDTPQEVMQLLCQLSHKAKAEVADPPINDQGARGWLDHGGGSDLMQRMHLLVDHYQQRRVERTASVRLIA